MMLRTTRGVMSRMISVLVLGVALRAEQPSEHGHFADAGDLAGVAPFLVADQSCMSTCVSPSLRRSEVAVLRVPT